MYRWKHRAARRVTSLFRSKPETDGGDCRPPRSALPMGRMLRLLARSLGFWLVAAAVVAAVVDGAKTIAASSLVITPLAETVALVAAGVRAEAPVVPEDWPWLLSLPLQFLLAAPTVFVLAVPGIVFLVLGAKRRPPSLSREFAA